MQVSQISPGHVRRQLTQWMSTQLPGTYSGPSEISVPTSIAFFLRPPVRPAEGAILLPPRRNAEFAHVHADGSLHLALALHDQHEVLAKGWGEKHPRHSPVNNVMMLYAPRDADELRIAKAVVSACYRYATGNAATATNRPARVTSRH
jgi:hypothetical protein